MKLPSIIYLINATLLLLHELESAYEREWEILRLPGKISGFLLLHIPILVILFYGIIEIEKGSVIGSVIGIVTGAGGLIPFVIHKIFVRRKEHFNRITSHILIYSNIVTGIGTIVLSVRFLT